MGVSLAEVLRRASSSRRHPEREADLPQAPAPGDSEAKRKALEAATGAASERRAPASRAHRLDGVRFTQHVESYRESHEAERETIKLRVMELLRQWGPEEKPLIGKQSITLWFASMGIGNRLGKGASWGCITGWRKRLACPIWRGTGPKAPAWSTDVLLRAWLLSLFSTDNPGGPRILRCHWRTTLHGPYGGPQDRARRHAESSLHAEGSTAEAG